MSEPTPALVPRPRLLRGEPGTHALGPATVIVAEPGVLASTARFLQATLGRATGWPFALAEPGPPSGTVIRLSLDPALSRLGPEGYQLDVRPAGITLNAAAEAGVFYAAQSLLQLLPPASLDPGPRIDVRWELPCVFIEDAPRFSWRGAMLDCGRHFMPVPFVKRFIDLLALHKLNTFHWHLTEDQGWRIEIKKYPRLTEIGSRRRETLRGHLDAGAGGDGLPHGGFYSQREIREIVAHAASRFVTIVPEIEMPGHAQAAIAAYPELGCTGRKLEVSTRWGVHENIFNVEATTFAFLEDVLDEVMELFPGRYIHIGGDEAVKTQWKNSLHIQATIRRLGLGDEHELQSYFVGRIGRHLASRGRRLVGWDEIIEGGIPDGATIMAWRGEEPLVQAARQGHDAIVAWSQATYLDFYQSSETATEPLAIHHVLTLPDAYACEPVPAALDAVRRRHVLGLQAQLWTEYIRTPEQVEYMAFPRLCALAEVAWSAAEDRDYADFRRRLGRHLKRLDVLGVRYRPPE